jgi:hypothetical protein
MTRNLMIASMLTTNLTGCLLYAYDTTEDPYVVVMERDNASPLVLEAGAGVFWDGGFRDDIWYFDAIVGDPNGIYDVTAVWVDVYDDFGGYALVESFPLYPTDDPTLWSSEWLGSSLYLDPFYRGYTVEFVVYDQWDAAGFLAVAPIVYAY